MLVLKTYPNNFKIKYEYDANGYLLGVKDAATNQFIWQTSEYNEMGQVQSVTLKNGHKITYTYDNMSMPQSMSYFKNMTNQMQLNFRLNYNFDQLTGNLLSRSDFLRNFEEVFQYDDLQRLEHITFDNVSNSIVYDVLGLGNIIEKADIGTIDYDPVKVHAVSEVVPFDQINLMWPNNQLIDYNANGKATKIEEGDYELNITYGYDNQRRKSIMTNNGQPVYTRYYLGKYEIEETPGGTKEICYIPGPVGNIAVYVTEGSTSEIYYTLTDHLGSIIAIVDEVGDIIEEQSFDAWGRNRNPSNWTYDNAQPISLLCRGYTGHEMLPEFGLVNMNGRMYDPVLGRMLSPDNYVQSPFMPQNYNRYSYAWNNPLKFTDPDGEVAHLIVGAVVFGFINWMVNDMQGNIDNGWQALGYFGIGAVAGALSAGIGAGIGAVYTGAGTFGAGFIGTTTATTSSLGVVGGFAAGFGGGFSSGFISGTGNSLMGGNTFGQSLQTGVNEGLKQGLIGGAIGGLVGGVSAYRSGNHALTGKPPHYQAELDNFQLVYQNDPMNCKNATLESIEKMQGGLRTQDDFKRMGDAFLRDNPNATLEEYFNYFGFDVQDPSGRSHKYVGNLMKNRHPTVINENIGGGHTLTITKIRQWTPNSNVKVWFGDPARGIWKTNFNVLYNPNFNLGGYSFILGY